MNHERWLKLDRLLDNVIELEPEAQAGFLARECAGDAELRRELEALLAGRRRADGLLEAPSLTGSELILDHQAETLIGTCIGHYRILREIGRGGMGIVCLAERVDDEYRGQAAIKLLWPGLNNAEIVRRFKRERQILANLHHPNIAQLFDGGTTEDGRPYFVMEYVEGAPITDYCNERQLSIAERLKLFQQVCAAAQYAHQNLIIHRDLKPGNILVTEAGGVKLPKLLDFGIARVLDPALHGVTARSTTSALMTPEYASPEQMRGEPITTASDVYSLGIVLYELLTGNHPYEIKDRSPSGMVRAVCEQEPEPPSQRAMGAEPAAQLFGETKPERLRAQLRGDLDQIIRTAIRKDAQLRYRNVTELSEDIRRHLAGETIAAHKGSVNYRLRKFVRRNKLGVAAAAFVLLTLIGGIIATAWQARIAREQARINRRLAYAGQMALATQAWEMANVARMRELVESYLPRDGEEDLRGFEWHYLWRLYHRTGERFNLKHPAEVWAVAFAPDGRRFATGCDDGKARLWDAATGELLAELSGHRQYIWAMAFSPDGRKLATGGGDRTVKIWEVATGRELATFTGHTNRVGAVAFSPDGAKLATNSRDGTARLWDAATGQSLLTIQTGMQWHTPLAFSPDGRKLAVWKHGCQRCGLKLYDTTTGRESAVQFGGDVATRSVAFSPDGKMIAMGGFVTPVKLLDAATGRELVALTGHTGEVYSLAFSPDGRMLATASADRTVKLWEVDAGKEIATLKGHSSQVFSIAFSPDGQSLVSGSADRTTRIWELATAAEPTVLKAGDAFDLKVAVSRDGQKLATNDGSILTTKLWDAATLREIAPLGVNGYRAWSMAFSPDGKTLATGSVDKTPRLWDAATGRELIAFSGHTDQARAVAFSPDGRQLATGSYDKTIKLWDAATGREIITLRGHAQRSEALAFSPDGKRLASGSYDTTAKLWDVASGRELATLRGHTYPILTLAFSPDGTMLATGSSDSLVKLWQVGAAREVTTIKGHAGHVTTLAFAPDGKRLATGGSEGLVRLWDVATGQELIALRGHHKVVNSVVFSAGGGTLFSSGDDGFVRLWRAATEQEVAAAMRK